MTVTGFCIYNNEQAIYSIGNDNIEIITFFNIIGFEYCKHVPDNFLSCCYSLESVDLSSFINVTSIGDYFLGACNSLEYVDFKQLPNIRKIGDYFMNDCKAIENIELEPFLNKGIVIGKDFLDAVFFSPQSKTQYYLMKDLLGLNNDDNCDEVFD